MNRRFDRTQIAPLLLRHFPHLAGASSDDWHAFLNEHTNLAVAVDEDNASAFDAWRQALARKGYAEVWGYTPSQLADIKARGQQLKATADRRLAAIGVAAGGTILAVVLPGDVATSGGATIDGTAIDVTPVVSA